MSIPRFLLLAEAPLIIVGAAGSFYVTARACWLLANRLLLIFGSRKKVALWCWACLSGLFIAPSMFTFGWFGAALGAHFKFWGALVMSVAIPVTVVIGAALSALLVTLAIFGVVGGLEAVVRLTNCPVFGRRTT